MKNRVLFSVTFAQSDVDLAKNPDHYIRFSVSSPRVVRKERLAEHDKINQVRHFEFRFEEFDTAGKLVRERLVPLYTRYIFRNELQLLLETVGFQVLDVFRDYNKNHYDCTGEMIVVTRRPQ